jgi:ribosome biogenesis protein Tsr3
MLKTLQKTSTRKEQKVVCLDGKGKGSVERSITKVFEVRGFGVLSCSWGCGLACPERQ